jgi:hypothetical protein
MQAHGKNAACEGKLLIRFTAACCEMLIESITLFDSRPADGPCQASRQRVSSPAIDAYMNPDTDHAL